VTPPDLKAMMRGLAVRNLVKGVIALLDLPSPVSLLDWGTGDGLLVRLLREAGVNAFGYDKFVEPLFDVSLPRSPDLAIDVMTAFEVFEHFIEPSREFEELFSHSPRLVLASTELYRGQGPDWTYLYPDIGRHVFFYSSEAIQMIGRWFGYAVVIVDRFIVFTSPPLAQGANRRLHTLLRNPERAADSPA
jgi:hypothetical protein